MPLIDLSAKNNVPADYLFWRSHAHFIFENVSAAVIAVNTSGCITIFNSEAEKVFNKTASIVLGKSLKAVFPNLPSHEYYLLKTLKTGKELKDVEHDYCPYADKVGVFSHSFALVKGEHNDIVGAIWLRKDITCERRFQREVNNAEIQAMVSQIAAGTAHEIRNPLTTAQGFIQLACQQCPEDARQHLEFALEELNQMNRTITDFLDFIHPKPEGLQFVSVNRLLEDLLQMIEKVGIMVKIEIISHLDQKIPLCLLDPELVKQAVLKVLRSGIKAMPHGGKLTVNTSYCQDADEVMINITDTGPTISAEDLSQIFKPLVSMKADTAGQGLTLANRIIQHQGGYLHVFSEKGLGTSVKMFFPVCER